MSFLSQPITIPFLRTPKRSFGGIDVNVIISENTTDNLKITQQPVQQGAMIADHAFKEPTMFNMSIMYADNNFLDGEPLNVVYQKLLDLQQSRIPFSILTPKRIYTNMLMASLAQTTDKKTENCLAINVTFQEVLIVNVATVQVSRSKQRNPGATGATQKAGRKSALLTGAQAVNPGTQGVVNKP